MICVARRVHRADSERSVRGLLPSQEELEPTAGHAAGAVSPQPGGPHLGECGGPALLHLAAPHLDEEAQGGEGPPHQKVYMLYSLPIVAQL